MLCSLFSAINFSGVEVTVRTLKEDIMRTHQTTSESVLDNSQATRLLDERPLRVQVVSGTAYVTREGDDRDYVLESGDVISFQAKGQIVVQGLPFARYRVLAQ